jgi:glucan phosphoethanolaminetransferase (alkaline phosphatase superfamily)
LTAFPFGTAFPGQFVIAALAEFHYLERGPQLPWRSPDIREIQYSGVISPKFRKIVFVMDESIRGDMTSLGDSKMDTTPFLAEYSSGLANFGVAVSAANCSLPSRFIMRYGIRAQDVPEMDESGARGPTMWQYAQRAGFKTVYINATLERQNPFLGVASTMMSPKEMASIDESIPITAKQTYNADQEAAVRLITDLGTPEKMFIYVDKFGAHFPYYPAFPPDSAKFPFKGDVHSAVNSRDTIKTVYKNAVAWSVDEFFKKVLSEADLSDTLLIYTSDHGQSLLEGNYKISHCSTTSQTLKGEGYVPLFVVTSKQPFEQQFRASAAESFGRASHFEIFPTLLFAFGFDERWIVDTYGSPLLNFKPYRHRKFYIGGQRWIDVD